MTILIVIGSILLYLFLGVVFVKWVSSWYKLIDEYGRTTTNGGLLAIVMTWPLWFLVSMLPQIIGHYISNRGRFVQRFFDWLGSRSK